MIIISRFVLLILFCLPFPVGAQLIKEYIVTNANDTIYGAVTYSRDEGVVTFEEKKDTSPKKYAAADIRFFFLKSLKLYESVQRPGTTEKVFLQLFVSGKISLYKQSKSNGFLLIKEGREYPLTTRDTIIDNHYHEDKKYTGLLKILMSDCEKVQKKTRIVRFNEDELTKLVEKYNECGTIHTGGKTEVFAKREPWMIGVKSGAVFSKLKFPAELNYFSRYDFDRTTSISYAIFGSVPLSRKLSAILEVVHVNKSAEANGDTKYGNIISKEDVYFNCKYNQVSISGRYSPFAGRFKPFAIIGFFFGRSPKLDGYRRIFIGDTDQVVRVSFDFTSRNEIGYTLGMGVNTEIGKGLILGLNYGYERATGNVNAGDNQFRFMSQYLSLSAGISINSMMGR
jgi:opacity protein-like surface antigen